MESDKISDLELERDGNQLPTMQEKHAPQTEDIDLAAMFWSAANQVGSETAFLRRFVLFGMILTALILILTPNRYTAATRVLAVNRQSSSNSLLLAAMMGGGGGGGGQVSAAASFFGIRTSGSQFIAVLKSRTIADEVINRFHLEQVYGTKMRQAARDQLAANSTFTEDRLAGLITINVTDRQPERAAGIANAYVEELNRLLVNVNTQGIHRQRLFLEEHLKGVTEELEAAEKKLSEFSSKNTTLEPTMQARSMMEAAAKLEGELIAQQAQLQGLSQIYSSESPRYRAVKARVDELERQLTKIAGTQSQLDDEQSATDTRYPSIRKLPLLAKTYADLFRHARVEQVVFESLTKQYEMTRMDEAENLPSVSVVDRAEAPQYKSGPKRLSSLLLAAILLFAFGSALVCFENYWRGVGEQHPAKVFAANMREKVAQGRLGRSRLVGWMLAPVRMGWLYLRLGIRPGSQY
jgi:capsule polysaccharide export protein KpsE/RkpR